MPVEINELVVRAVVRDDARAAGAPAGGSANRLSEEGREALVEACVREVLRVLRRTRER